MLVYLYAINVCICHLDFSQTQKSQHGRNRLEMVTDVPLSSTFNLESVTELRFGNLEEK